MKIELKSNPNHHCHNNRAILSQSLTDHSNSHRSNSEVSGSVAYQETKCVEADMKPNIYSRVVFFQSSVRRSYWQNHIYIYTNHRGQSRLVVFIHSAPKPVSSYRMSQCLPKTKIVDAAGKDSVHWRPAMLHNLNVSSTTIDTRSSAWLWHENVSIPKVTSKAQQVSRVDPDSPLLASLQSNAVEFSLHLPLFPHKAFSHRHTWQYPLDRSTEPLDYKGSWKIACFRMLFLATNQRRPLKSDASLLSNSHH